MAHLLTFCSTSTVEYYSICCHRSFVIFLISHNPLLSRPVTQYSIHLTLSLSVFPLILRSSFAFALSCDAFFSFSFEQQREKKWQNWKNKMKWMERMHTTFATISRRSETKQIWNENRDRTHTHTGRFYFTDQKWRESNQQNIILRIDILVVVVGGCCRLEQRRRHHNLRVTHATPIFWSSKTYQFFFFSFLFYFAFQTVVFALFACACSMRINFYFLLFFSVGAEAVEKDKLENRFLWRTKIQQFSSRSWSSSSFFFLLVRRILFSAYGIEDIGICL